MNHFNSESENRSNQWRISWMAGLCILLGFLFRLYSFCFTPVINPDGILYIQQAKALHYGLMDSVLSCYSYLSNYPIFIAIIYKLTGDWVIAAKGVSLFFGTLTLIPLYWLVRRFFSETISSLTLLIFALIPSFIDSSRDVLRDPVYWFFSMLGLYLFILQIEKRNNLFVFLSSISFIMGAWARVECILFFIMSLFYLLVVRLEGKWRRLFFFFLPVFLIFSISILQVFIFQKDANVIKIFRPERIISMPKYMVQNYQMVRENMENLIDQGSGSFKYFLSKVRNLVWLIALGALFVKLIDAFFLPFFFIFILGIIGSRDHIKKDLRLIYLTLLSSSALIVLYCQIMYNWAMSIRFAPLFLFPAFVFMGFAVEKIVNFIQNRYNIRLPAAYVIMCLLILIIAVPKDVRSPDRKERAVFKEIGEFISLEEENGKAISVAGTNKRVRLVHFYANLNYPGAPCHKGHLKLNGKKRFNAKLLEKKKFDYFMWDDKSGSKSEPEFNLRDTEKEIIKLKEWRSSKYGRLILYKVKS